MFGLSSLYIKLIGGAIAALILFGLIADRSRWMRRAHGAEAQVSAACDATRTAAKRPKLDCKQMPQQIQFLGDALNDVAVKTEAAKAQDAAHAQEVETKQNVSAQESSHDYQADLARIRADYAERLRRAHGSATADQGRGGKPSVPSPAPSASGPNAAAAQTGLPSADALTATEQAYQLKAFQEWAKKVGLAH